MKRVPCFFFILLFLFIEAGLLHHPAIGQNSEQNMDSVFLDFSMAMMSGRTDEFLALLDKHPEVIQGRQNGYSLLQSVVTDPMMSRNTDAQIKLVRELILRGADLEWRNERTGLTALGMAIEYHNYGIVDTLLAYGAIDDMFLAAMRGDEQKVSEFAALDPTCVNAKNSDGNSLLHILASCEREERARFQMEEASPRALAEEGQRAVAAYLVEHGADMTMRDSEGKTPLHTAAINGRDDILQVLLDHGADVNATNADGEIPLHLAVWHNRYNATEALLKNGSRIDEKDNIGVTAYQWAVLKGYKPLEELLAGYNADMIEISADAKETWRNYLDSPFDEQRFLIHSNLIGWNPAEKIGDWYIGSVYRAKRCKTEPYYVVEINNGIEGKSFKPGSIVVFDSKGEFLREIPSMGIGIMMVYEFYENSSELSESARNLDRTVINDLPDLTGDGYADIPVQGVMNFRERIPKKISIYIISDRDIPCVFTIELFDNDISWEGRWAGRWPLDDIPFGYLFVRPNRDSPFIDIMVNVMLPHYNSAGQVIGHLSIPNQTFRMLARYVWDEEQQTFTGPAEGPNGLWKVRQQDSE